MAVNKVTGGTQIGCSMTGDVVFTGGHHKPKMVVKARECVEVISYVYYRIRQADQIRINGLLIWPGIFFDGYYEAHAKALRKFIKASRANKDGFHWVMEGSPIFDESVPLDRYTPCISQDLLVLCKQLTVISMKQRTILMKSLYESNKDADSDFLHCICSLITAFERSPPRGSFARRVLHETLKHTKSSPLKTTHGFVLHY